MQQCRLLFLFVTLTKVRQLNSSENFLFVCLISFVNILPNRNVNGEMVIKKMKFQDENKLMLLT